MKEKAPVFAPAPAFQVVADFQIGDELAAV
jgi:hypothetical protein